MNQNKVVFVEVVKGDVKMLWMMKTKKSGTSFLLMSSALVTVGFLMSCAPQLNRHVSKHGDGVHISPELQEKCEGPVTICSFSFANRGRLLFVWEAPINNENSFRIRFCQDDADCSTRGGGSIDYTIQCNGNTCHASIDGTDAILVSVMPTGNRKTFTFVDNQAEWVLDPGSFYEIQALTSSEEGGFAKGTYLNN